MFGGIRRLPSKRYQARFTGPDKRRYTGPCTYPDKLSAYAWLAQQRKAIDLGIWQPPTTQHSQCPTIRELAHQWLGTLGVRTTSLVTYQNILDTRVLNHPVLAELPINQLDTHRVHSWWRWVVSTFPNTPDRNRKAHQRLRTLAAYAVELGYLDSNPVDVKAAKRQPPRKNKQLPETKDLHAVLDHTPARYRFAVCLALFHGLRIGEALGIEAKHVTRTPGGFVIRVEQALKRIQEPGKPVRAELGPPKSPAAYRDVPVLTVFNPLVEQAISHTPTGLLTTTSQGKPVLDTSLREVFNRAKKKAGAPAELTFHYGRNWLITTLAEQGATPTEIGRILGQKDVSTIVNIYMKVRETRPDELMKRVEESGLS